MSELSPEARALIDASRGEDEPSAEDRARIGRKLAEQLPSFAASAALPKIQLDPVRIAGQSQTAAGASGLLGSGLTKVATFSMAALLAGSAAFVFVRNPETAARPSTHVPEPVPEAVPDSPPPAPILAPIVEVAPPQRLPRRTARAERRTSSRARAEPTLLAPPREAPAPAEVGDGAQAEPEPVVATAAPQVQARTYEMADPAETPQATAPRPMRVPRGPDQGAKLLAEARAAFEDGDPERALELTEQHAISYPKSTLAEERIALRGLALCALQRVDEGLRVLRTARAAQSPLHGAALRACKNARGR